MIRKFSFIDSMNIDVKKLKDKNVLVTGANGLIASNFVELLLEISEENKLNTTVYALCRNEKKAEERFADSLSNPNFKLLIQDVIEPLPSEYSFDYIVHAASMAYPGAFNTVPVDVMKANFIGSLNMLELAGRKKGSRFMFVSSSEVYGENEERKEIFTEDMQEAINFTRFRACYPESKRASETLCFCYGKQYDQDFVIVRPAYIYGKEISVTNTRADAYFMNQAIEHKDIVMFSKGEQIRSYLYVKDCVSAMLITLLSGENGEIYNIGDETCEVTLAEYAKLLAEESGIKVIFNIDENDKLVFLKTTKLILDTTKLRGLGWTPYFSLRDGIKDCLS